MKFQKKITVCRWDGNVPFTSFVDYSNISGDNCSNYIKGKCLMDQKPCKIVTYILQHQKEGV